MNASLRIGTLALAASALVAALPLGATELGAAARPAGLRIHSADETLRDYCAWVDGKLTFTVPGGASWELVTSTADPAIANPGDGQFHPFDVAEVQAALDGIRFPLQRVGAEIFVLPYPRRLGLESAAGPGVVLLSPGVRAMASQTQQAEVVHEMGHVVQYALMPDADTQAWERYRTLRGITDDAVYSGDAMHANRPHEIFAEDFRALFGPALANVAGTIENDALVYPTQVSGLAEFMLALAGAAPKPGALLVLGGGSTGAVRLARDGRAPVALDLFDVTGRRLATVAPVADAAGASWIWDGRDASGHAVRATVVFARARDGQGGVARIIRLP